MVIEMLQKSNLKSAKIGKRRQENELSQGAGTWAILQAQEQRLGGQEEAFVSGHQKNLEGGIGLS